MLSSLPIRPISVPDGYLKIWWAITHPATGEAFPYVIYVAETLEPVLHSEDVDVLYKRILEPFEAARRGKASIGCIRRASELPKWNFVDSSRNGMSFGVDAPASTEETGIDNVRVVISWPVIVGVSRIWFALVVMGCQSELKDVISYLCRDL